MVPAVYNTTIVYTASDLETNYPILVVRSYVLANLIMRKERVWYSDTARSTTERMKQTEAEKGRHQLPNMSTPPYETSCRPIIHMKTKLLCSCPMPQAKRVEPFLLFSVLFCFHQVPRRTTMHKRKGLEMGGFQNRYDLSVYGLLQRARGWGSEQAAYILEFHNWYWEAGVPLYVVLFYSIHRWRSFSSKFMERQKIGASIFCSKFYVWLINFARHF